MSARYTLVTERDDPPEGYAVFQTWELHEGLASTPTLLTTMLVPEPMAETCRAWLDGVSIPHGLA